MEIAKPGHMPGVHHSSEGGGQSLLTIRFNSWFWIICPSGFTFFLASSLLGPGGVGVLPSWFFSFSLSPFSFPVVPTVSFSFHHSIFVSHDLYLSISFSFFQSHPSSASPLGFILHLPALVFPSWLLFSLSLVLHKENFHVTLTENTAVSHNVTKRAEQN